ncbi:MotA/TolQ/ExbB proton channel family protein [bacterium]|nr:MotA/TolQ/ExbB proton channel family protein [bacterium]MBU3955358.1 MotA/TolQ/ExbB proton channel family protein [bacterium]MBU4134185.1 MotA/TolQ/ExbB proton channel family protein [bacterium]
MSYLIKGGPVMFLLAIFSIAAIAIIINRLRFYKSCNVDGTDLINAVLKYIRAGSPESAVALCEEKQGPLAAVIKAGLSYYSSGADIMEEAFQSQELKEMPLLEEHLSTLSTIASVSTLVGFTGTVTGMIKAFNNIAQAGASSPAIVASGISQALLTTAAGLLIAVPAVIFVRYFENRVDRFVNEIDFATHELTRASKNILTAAGVAK